MRFSVIRITSHRFIFNCNQGRILYHAAISTVFLFVTYFFILSDKKIMDGYFLRFLYFFFVFWKIKFIFAREKAA